MSQPPIKQPRQGFFLYSRKSTEAEDRQVLSINSQIDEVKTLAERLGLRIVEVFSEARSAKAPGRPVFDAMMRQLYAGQAQGVLCWKLDRLARNPVDGGSVIWAIKQHGIRIITPTQSYSHNDDNIILMYIEFGMAQKYIDDLRDDIAMMSRLTDELRPYHHHHRGENIRLPRRLSCKIPRHAPHV